MLVLMLALIAIAPPYKLIGPAGEIADEMVMLDVLSPSPNVSPLPTVVALIASLIFAANVVEFPLIVRLPFTKAETIADALTLAFPVSVHVLPLTVMFVKVGPLWPDDSTVRVCEKPICASNKLDRDKSKCRRMYNHFDRAKLRISL